MSYTNHPDGMSESDKDPRSPNYDTKPDEERQERIEALVQDYWTDNAMIQEACCEMSLSEADNFAIALRDLPEDNKLRQIIDRYFHSVATRYSGE